jgi:hypothetical protein
MTRSWYAARLAAAALACAGGCRIEDGRPPVARIALLPPAIPENDGFRTAVTLDGSASSDAALDAEAATALDYAWRVLGDEYQPPDADLGAPAPTLRFRGDTPATIELTVTDAEGLSGTARLRLQLSVSSRQPMSP